MKRNVACASLASKESTGIAAVLPGSAAFSASTRAFTASVSAGFRGPRFEPVERQTVTETVRDALLESIRSGALLPGSRLPSERSLCEEFGVARTSVREAIQGLVSLGIITKRANRPYVAEQLPGLVGHLHPAGDAV